MMPLREDIRIIVAFGHRQFRHDIRGDENHGWHTSPEKSPPNLRPRLIQIDGDFDI